MSEDRQALIEDEWLIVRHSGEIPEIALSSVLFYLTEDPEGPLIELSEEEMNHLTRAAELRYHEIVLRDLQPENRDKTIYRGIKRTIYNYHRFLSFCHRRNVDTHPFQLEVARHFLTFLKQEKADVQTNQRSCSVNVPYSGLVKFAEDLGLAEIDLPTGFEKICLSVSA